MDCPVSEMQPDFVGPKISHQMRHYRRYPERNRERRKRHYLENRQRLLREQRDYKYRVAYGITLEEFELINEKQNCLCLICGKVSTDGKSLHVDHCHSNGHIRGLLCNICNRGIGNFYDDPELLERAAKYLRDNK